MRGVVLVFLLVGSALGLEPLVGYHDAVGIPLARTIRDAEESLMSNEEVSTRIVGGAVATTNAHPYLGGLVISFWNIAGNSLCGSSLLTASRLVTAAHCWWDGRRQASQFEVVLGSQWLFFGGIRIPTSNVVMHPQYIPSALANDVAMIYLPMNVAFSQGIQPISLPSGNQLFDTFAGQWAIASGYGKTHDHLDVTTTTQISQVFLQVIPTADCQRVFGAHQVLASNVCTNGFGGVGICNGDSGGPLVVNSNGQNVLIGISSFVAQAGCQLGHPSAFARVTSFSNFILQHLW